ncbi:MAG: DUF2490 domain-containing protein [Chryseobacterium sp.]|nr:DUF2490 domain-containing protein [Chryseobacterium sp.]
MDKKILVIIAVNIFLFVNGQKENLSSFNAVSLTYQFHPKFFAFSEFQLRGNKDFYHPDYNAVRGGLGYKVRKNNSALIGFALINNYGNKIFNRQEIRIYLQDVITQKSGIFKFENRFLLEQSWIYEPLKDLSSTRNRFRYRLNISAPLNSKKVEPGTLSANIYDEVYFSTPQKPAFSRNRLFNGISYQVSKELSLSSGYLWERNLSLIKNNNFHYLYFACNINLDK